MRKSGGMEVGGSSRRRGSFSRLKFIHPDENDSRLGQKRQLEPIKPALVKGQEKSSLRGKVNDRRSNGNTGKASWWDVVR